MKQLLGIDIGGTNVKFGIVTIDGELIDQKKIPTEIILKDAKSLDLFISEIRSFLKAYPSVTKVGIGIPGTLCNDKKKIISLNNIPVLNGLSIISMLENAISGIRFFAENDANAAALGEYHFAKSHKGNDFFFITLGTGVGGAIMLNGKLFQGSKGNAVEIHNNPSREGQSFEDYLGNKGWIREAAKMHLKHYPEEVLDWSAQTPKSISEFAQKGENWALELFEKQGEILGELIVSAVRFFDIRNIYLGGGVTTGTFPFMKESMNKVLKRYLDEYYLNDLIVEKAELENEAGILGAAALCFGLKSECTSVL